MNKGFTLIEVLIYTALVGIILTSVVLSTQVALQIRGKTRAELLLQENVRFAMTRITSIIRTADGIIAPEDIGIPTNILTLDVTETAQDPTTFTLTDGVITITEGTLAPIALTDNAVKITELSFLRLNGTPAPIHITITGETQNANNAYSATTTLNSLALPHE